MLDLKCKQNIILFAILFEVMKTGLNFRVIALVDTLKYSLSLLFISISCQTHLKTASLTYVMGMLC